MSSARPAVGLIGVGLLGSAIAERLLLAGYPLVGFDLDATRRAELAARGGGVAECAADVPRACRRVLLSLPTSAVVAQVIAGLEAALQPGDLVIDTSTGDPEASAALGQRLATGNVHYLDATVAGSSEEARQGAVVVMAGGPRAAFDACADLFAAFAARSFHLGPWGSGARTKLVVNLVLGLHRAVLAEGLALAGKLGLDAAATLDVLKAGVAYSRVMDTKGDKMLARDFTPQARLAQHLKDVRLILDAGARVAARLPLSEAHRRLLEQLDAAGLGALDNSAILRAYAEE